MSSLHRHLTRAGSCAGLAYRHDCPRCRAERLAGTLPYPDGLLSRRARALVLAAALGASGSPASTGLLDPPPADAALGTEEADPDADDAGDGPTEEDTVTPEDGDPSQAPPITEPDGPSEDIDGELPGRGETAPAPALSVKTSPVTPPDEWRTFPIRSEQRAVPRSRGRGVAVVDRPRPDRPPGLPSPSRATREPPLDAQRRPHRHRRA